MQTKSHLKAHAHANDGRLDAVGSLQLAWCMAFFLLLLLISTLFAAAKRTFEEAGHSHAVSWILDRRALGLSTSPILPDDDDDEE